MAPKNNLPKFVFILGRNTLYIQIIQYFVVLCSFVLHRLCWPLPMPQKENEEWLVCQLVAIAESQKP